MICLGISHQIFMNDKSQFEKFVYDYAIYLGFTAVFDVCLFL